MAARTADPEATLVKVFEPIQTTFALLSAPTILFGSEPFRQEPVQGTSNVRGPPEPDHRPDAPRAPPIARV